MSGSNFYSRILPAVTATVALAASASESNAATVFLDFGLTPTTTTSPTWNNVGSGAVVANAKDSTGADTGIGIAVSGFNGDSTSGGTATSGPTPGMNGTAATAFGGSNITAAQDYSYINSNVATAVGSVALTGLDPNQTYTFTIFAARNTNASTDFISTYTATGLTTQSGTLDAQYNIDKVLTLSDIAPTATGAITLTVRNTDGNSYINAVRVDGTVVPEPATVGLIGLAGLVLAGRRRRQ